MGNEYEREFWLISLDFRTVCIFWNRNHLQWFPPSSYLLLTLNATSNCIPLTSHLQNYSPLVINNLLLVKIKMYFSILILFHFFMSFNPLLKMASRKLPPPVCRSWPFCSAPTPLGLLDSLTASTRAFSAEGWCLGPFSVHLIQLLGSLLRARGSGYDL